MNVLQERLAFARANAGLTQAQIAGMMKLPRTAITQMENGFRKCSALELAALASYYGCDAGWLLTGKSMSTLQLSPLQQARFNKLSATDQAAIKRLLESL